MYRMLYSYHTTLFCPLLVPLLCDSNICFDLSSLISRLCSLRLELLFDPTHSLTHAPFPPLEPHLVYLSYY